jgi:hypothetical protein
MRLSLIIAVGLLGGCNDPYRWPGHWDAAQVNELNLAVQASDWRDLAAGHGDPGSDGQEAAAAVDRLRKGVIKPLASGTVSDIASGSTASSAAAAPPSN